MGQAICCGTRGAAGPAAGTWALPGAPDPAAPAARRSLWRRAASRAPLGAFVSSRSPGLLLTLRVEVTRDQHTRDRYLLLFAHAVAIATLKFGSLFRLRHRVRLRELWVLCGEEAAADRSAQDGEPSGLRCSHSVVLAWPAGSCVVTFGSQEEKQLCLDALIRQSAGAPGARLTRLRSLRFLSDVVSFSGPEPPLTADVLQRLLSGEIGSKVFPRLEPSEREEALGPVAGEPGSSAHGDISGPLPAGSSLPLFGQPLAAVCGAHGGLAQPLQEILDILDQQGPETEGIFSVAGSHKERQELRKVLDQGQDADLHSRPVHLLAMVLKDFLRSIPSKLLQEDLYEEWIQALEKPSHQDKIDHLKEVAGRLPGANLLLFQRLLAVLHRISEHVETSRMGATKLATCVGPSLLSLGGDSVFPTEDQMESKRKVTALVTFLIENWQDIEESITLPFDALAKESPVDSRCSTGHPGTPQHEGSVCDHPEPAAGGSSPIVGMELPQERLRSSSVTRPFPRCASAPALPNVTNDTSRMVRCFSHPDLSKQNCFEGHLETPRPDVTAGDHQEPRAEGSLPALEVEQTQGQKSNQCQQQNGPDLLQEGPSLWEHC